jgi:predicted aspartyl protease
MKQKTLAKAQLEAADAIYRQGRFVQAEASYLKVQELDPKNPGVLSRLGTIALWSNRLEEAENYFKAAMDCAPGLQKFWPFNAQLKTSLAMTYYRQDRFLEAARFFKEAAGPVALGPFRDIKALGQHLALFGKETPYVIAGPEETQVDFVITDPLPVVEVAVNGSKPLSFVIDTGGAEVILDTELAKEVGAEISGTMTGESAGPKGTIGLGKVDSMTIGKFTVKSVPIHTVDTDPFAVVFGGLNVKGVIGTRLLMHVLGTIDYVKGCLTLRRKTTANLQKLEAQVETQRVKVIPFWLIQTHYIVAWGTVNGEGPMLFFVDTGLAGNGFTAPESTLQEAGVTVDWTKAQEGIGGFGEVKEVDIVLDQLTLGTGPNEMVGHNVPGVALEQPPVVLGDHLGFRIGGLISHQFFRNYALTFDFVGMRLFLEEKEVST